MRDADYDAFWQALPTAALLGESDGTAERFRFQYREELLALLNMLRRIGVIWDATSLHPAPAESCDLCHAKAEDCQLMVDGVTAAGTWANMCPKCFLESGHAIGWGTGQLYLNLGHGRWRLVAGGDADAIEERE